MTDREILLQLIAKIRDIDKCIIAENYFEIDNTCYGECISFSFDEKGNLKDIFS